jgi:hypothetical protein
MSLRKRCPFCNHPWPDKKDPADDGKHLSALRLADLSKGLQAGSDAFEAEIFQEPVNEATLAVVAQRILDLDDAAYIAERCLDKLHSAQASLAATPAAMSLAAHIQAEGVEVEGEGLERCWKLEAGEFVLFAEGDTIRIGEKGADDEC